MPPQRSRAGFCVSDGALSQGPTGVHLRESLGTMLNGGVWRPLCVPGRGSGGGRWGVGTLAVGHEGLKGKRQSRTFPERTWVTKYRVTRRWRFLCISILP